MNYVSYITGKPFSDEIPNPIQTFKVEKVGEVFLYFPIQVKHGDSQYQDELTRWMFYHGYIPEKKASEGGPGSGNIGHEGIPGHQGGSQPQGGHVPEFQRFTPGPPKDKKIVIKTTYPNGAEVMAYGPLSDEKYLPTPEAMDNYVNSSPLFQQSDIGVVRFETSCKAGVGGFYSSPNGVEVSTRDSWAPKKYGRDRESIVRALTHELSHHEYFNGKLSSKVDHSRVSMLMLKEYKGLEMTGVYAVGDHLKHGDADSAIMEFFAYASESHFHDTGFYLKCPETDKYLGELYGK